MATAAVQTGGPTRLAIREKGAGFAAPENLLELSCARARNDRDAGGTGFGARGEPANACSGAPSKHAGEPGALAEGSAVCQAGHADAEGAAQRG